MAPLAQEALLAHLCGHPRAAGLQISLCTQCHGGLSLKSFSAFPKAHGDSGAQGYSRPWQDAVLTESQESGSIRHWGCSLPLLRILYSKGSLFRVIPCQMPPAVGKALAQQC